MLHDPTKDYNEKGQLLLKAAAYMEEHGHCRGILWNDEGNVCLMGALLACSVSKDLHRANDPMTHSCLDLVGNHLREVYSYDRDPITWNNLPDRKAEEVINALRATAETQKLVIA